MSERSPFICKQCGSDDIYAEVEATGSVGGNVRERNGKPVFDRDWDIEYDDIHEMRYVCGGCHKGHCSLADLVTESHAEGQLLRPCGRCDHPATDHELLNVRHRPEFTRGPMPCFAEGCDCHDYYDLEIANVGQAA